MKSAKQTAKAPEDRLKTFVKDVKEGEVITNESVRRIRPGFGLEAKYFYNVIGSKCLISAKRGDRVTMQHFAKRCD